MRLHGVERGDGTPLVWAHGLLSSKEATISVLREVRGHRVIAYDQRGHGESAELETSAQAVLGHFVRDLLAVLDALEIESAVLGGESMGAAVVLQFAVAHPTRVRALVLDRPAIGASETTSYSWRDEARALEAVGIDGWMQGALRDLPPEVRRAVTDRYQQHWRRHRTRSIVSIFEAMSDWHIPGEAALSQLDLPAVVRSWPGDPVHPRPLAEWLASALPRGRFVHVDRAAYHDEARDALSLASCVAAVGSSEW